MSLCYDVLTSSPQPQAEAVRGMLRINNDQLESPIAQVSCSVTTTMTATEIVGLALIKFDLLVRWQVARGVVLRHTVRTKTV